MEIEAENLAADIMGAWAKKDHSKAELLKKAEASIAPARKFVDQLNHALREGTVELSARFGEWDAKEDKASATVKALPGRQVFMKKMEGRWFLENRQQ